jgi:HEAT repeat protein
LSWSEEGARPQNLTAHQQRETIRQRGDGEESDKSDDPESALLMAMSDTLDPSVRNAAALALVDIGSQKGIQRIQELLQDPKTYWHRGTLIYALTLSKTRLDVFLLMILIFLEPPEAREEALDLLEVTIDSYSKQDIHKAMEIQSYFSTQGKDDRWLRVYQDVREALERMR